MLENNEVAIERLYHQALASDNVCHPEWYEIGSNIRVIRLVNSKTGKVVAEKICGYMSPQEQNNFAHIFNFKTEMEVVDTIVQAMEAE